MPISKSCQHDKTKSDEMRGRVENVGEIKMNIAGFYIKILRKENTLIS
jgi:hypothetical protein